MSNDSSISEESTTTEHSEIQSEADIEVENEDKTVIQPFISDMNQDKFIESISTKKDVDNIDSKIEAINNKIDQSLIQSINSEINENNSISNDKYNENENNSNSENDDKNENESLDSYKSSNSSASESSSPSEIETITSSKLATINNLLTQVNNTIDKKRKRLTSSQESVILKSKALPYDFELIPETFIPVCKTNDNLPKRLHKYWWKRERLFSLYDHGIWMDEEGWYSVTPEKVALYLADRLSCNVIVDGFCGVGGNAIQFARTCQHVIAIEKDPLRLGLAKHNAEIYGVAHKIEFILGDFFNVIPRLKADCIFLSPPWGGPSYNQLDKFDLTQMEPYDGQTLFNAAKQVSSNIVYFLPRNCDYKQVASLSKNATCEIEEVYDGYSFVAITAYFGPKVVFES